MVRGRPAPPTPVGGATSAAPPATSSTMPGSSAPPPSSGTAAPLPSSTGQGAAFYSTPSTSMSALSSSSGSPSSSLQRTGGPPTSKSMDNLSSVVSATNLPSAMRRVRALYDCKGSTANELDFAAGDVMTLIDSTASDWWTVRNQVPFTIDCRRRSLTFGNANKNKQAGQTGLVPFNYVELIEEERRAPPPMPVRRPSSGQAVPASPTTSSPSQSLTSSPNPSPVPVPAPRPFGTRPAPVVPSTAPPAERQPVSPPPTGQRFGSTERLHESGLSFDVLCCLWLNDHAP